MADFENKAHVNEQLFLRKKWHEFDSIEVTSIIDTRLSNDHKRYYLASFKSWIPEDSLLGYEGLLAQFWKKKKTEKTQIDEQWNSVEPESHSDKENNVLPFENLPSQDSLLPRGNRSPSYEKNSPSFVKKSSPFEKNTSFECRTPPYDKPSPCSSNNSPSLRIDSPQYDPESPTFQSKDTPPPQNGHQMGDFHDKLNENRNNGGEHTVEQNGGNTEVYNNLMNGQEFENSCESEVNDDNTTHILKPLVNGDESSKVVDVSMRTVGQSNKQVSCHNEGIYEEEEEYEEERNTRPSSGFSDKTNSSSSERSCDRPIKKRKLKTLDDIVRKISGTTDPPKKICHDGYRNDRLQTLEKTLCDDYTETENDERKKSPRVEENVNDKSPMSLTSVKEEKTDVHNEYSRHLQPVSGPYTSKEENVYWSSGKAFHKPSRPFRCFTCEQKFEFEDELITHQRLYHDNKRNTPEEEHALNDVQRVYNCRHCGDSFDSIPSLDRHRFEAHKGRRRYEKCQFCSTMYSDPVLLRRHEESHFRTYEQSHGRHKNNGHLPPLHNESAGFQRYSEHSDQANGHVNRSMADSREYLRLSPSFDEPRVEHRNGHGQENGSIIRKPIRNLLGKMYHSHRDPVSPYQSDGVKQRDVPPHHTTPHHVGESAKREKSLPWQRDSVSTSSVTYMYAQFMQEQHGFPPELHSPSFERPNPLPPLYKDNGNDSSEHDGFRELLRICPVCKKSFGKKETFDHHWIMTHGDKPIFNCDACKKTFFKEEEFNAHIVSHNQGALSTYETRDISQERPYQCHICGRSFSLKTNLRRHILIHNEITPYRCQFCAKTFKVSDELNVHMQEFHGRCLLETGRRHAMERQGKEETYLLDDIHRRNTNGVNPPSPVYHKQNGRSSEHFRNQDHYIDETKLKPFDPKQISHMNPHRMQGMQQMPVEQKRMYRHNGDDLTNQQSIKMVPVITPSQYSPNAKQSSLMVPPQLSTKMKCHECDEEFTSQSLFEIHLQSHVKEVFSCTKCPKTFSKRSLFDSHVLTHETNKSHNCPYCHRSFSMKGNLRRHIRIHTNEAPYECPICFQRFRRSDGLKGHIKRHETMGESAPTDMVPSQASA